METDDPHAGRAAGHAVDEDPEGGFRWSAFGPGGTRRGHAQSRGDAEAAAQAAEQELSRPGGRPAQR